MNARQRIHNVNIHNLKVISMRRIISPASLNSTIANQLRLPRTRTSIAQLSIRQTNRHNNDRHVHSLIEGQQTSIISHNRFGYINIPLFRRHPVNRSILRRPSLQAPKSARNRTSYATTLSSLNLFSRLSNHQILAIMRTNSLHTFMRPNLHITVNPRQPRRIRIILNRIRTRNHIQQRHISRQRLQNSRLSNRRVMEP